MTGTTGDFEVHSSASGWRDLLLRVYAGISEHRIFSLAAASTYYGLLAIFPAMAALVAIYGLFSDSNAISQQLTSLKGLVPEGALDVVGNELKRIASQNNSTLGFAMTAGLLAALWSANSAVKAVFDSLNQIYGEKEERGYIRLTLITLSFTAGAIALLALAIAGIVALPIALDQFGLSGMTSAVSRFVRWPLLFVVVALALSLVYRFGPSCRTQQWKWLTVGSVTAAALWMIASLLFSWYAANFGSFNRTYGSLGAVIGFMVWLWISIIVVLLGAEIDAQLEHVRTSSSE